MPVLESRPYRTALPSSVNVSIELVEPECSMEEIGRRWRPGQPIEVEVEASLDPAFWSETGIDPTQPVMLVVTATCLPARAAWRSVVPIGGADPNTPVRAAVVIDGSVVAGELLLECWIAGPGQTLAADQANAVHPGAKLWQQVSPLRISLEDSRSAFPTTVIAFLASGRPAVPWLVETVADAEPDWTIDASIRLLLNSDIPSSSTIADGSAEEHIYALIQADIRMAAIQGVSLPDSQKTASELEQIAEAVPESLAGLAVQSANSMGLTLARAMSLAKEDPTLLAGFARESARFYRRAETP